MRPEVDMPHSGVPAVVPVVLFACIVALVGVAFAQLEQRAQRDRRIGDLEHDLAAERDRTVAATVARIVPRTSTPWTTAAIGLAECGMPTKWVVNAGVTNVVFPSGCRIDVETVCRP